ncbi:MAG: PKD domain-containing protein, partial [Crocinitomicaceae bacterium]|nr:PKD domain-containing protein [Crocinitomicaceae bacterium]
SSFGLNGGTYTSEIIINSNDPLNPQWSVPYTLTVASDPCSDFSYDSPNACTGEINFTDQTYNNPTSWQWNFGDGSTSNAQHPTHVYTSAGNFIVELIACNATSCDTISYTINVTSTTGPIAASCTSGSVYSYSNYDITNVSLNTINNASMGSITGYQDYTCTNSTTLTQGIDILLISLLVVATFKTCVYGLI